MILKPMCFLPISLMPSSLNKDKELTSMGEAEGRKLIQMLVKELEQCLWECQLVEKNHGIYFSIKITRD